MVRPRFKLEMDFNLNNIKLDLHKELNLIGGIIVKDHKDRLESSTDVNGKPLKKLRPNTIASKRAKGYAKPTKPLIATGTAFANRVKHTGVPKREFWGITKEVSAKAMKFIELEVERILRNV